MHAAYATFHSLVCALPTIIKIHCRRRRQSHTHPAAPDTIATFHMARSAFDPTWQSDPTACCCAGLDANAALVVTQCISRLCTSGDHLVIASIHQPRAAIWDLFNRVVLLSEGYTLYCGPTADVRPLPHLSSFASSTGLLQHSSWGGLVCDCSPELLLCNFTLAYIRQQLLHS